MMLLDHVLSTTSSFPHEHYDVVPNLLTKMLTGLISPSSSQPPHDHHSALTTTSTKTVFVVPSTTAPTRFFLPARPARGTGARPHTTSSHLLLPHRTSFAGTFGVKPPVDGLVSHLRVKRTSFAGTFGVKPPVDGLVFDDRGLVIDERESSPTFGRRFAMANPEKFDPAAMNQIKKREKAIADAVRALGPQAGRGGGNKYDVGGHFLPESSVSPRTSLAHLSDIPLGPHYLLT